MRNKKQLPYITPAFSTYHYQICNAIPLSLNKSYYNWFLNECIVLKCKNDLFNITETLDVTTENTSFTDNPNLDIEYLKKCIKWEDLLEFIFACINSSTYVYFCGADDYFIPKKSFYHKDHIFHDGLIIGYDNENELLSIVAYDENWVCKILKVHYADFRESLAYTYYQKKIAYFVSIKPNLNNIPIDIYRIKSLLNQYILSLENEQINPSEKRGLAVYDNIIDYISAIQIGYIPLDCIDWRILRSLWEHKKCMYDRIVLLERYISSTNKFSSEYKTIVSTTDNLRMMYARYMLNADNAILSNFIEALLKTKDEEYKILQQIIDVLNQKRS